MPEFLTGFVLGAFIRYFGLSGCSKGEADGYEE